MKIHEFDNGIKVFDDQLTKIQRERYGHKNVHEEDEEEIFLSVVRNLPEGAVYVNVGAAIGYYPLLAKKLRGDLQIHCFEPLPIHLEYFRRNMKLNGFSENDFTLHEIAISSDSGEAMFRDNSYGSSLASESKKPKPLKRRIKDAIKQILGKPASNRAFKVGTLKLSEASSLVKTDRIDLLQMDIQGFEEPVLKTYFADYGEKCLKVVTFLIGTHGPEIHAKCKSYLEAGGFHIQHDEQDTENQPDGILLGSLVEEMNRR